MKYRGADIYDIEPVYEDDVPVCCLQAKCEACDEGRDDKEYWCNIQNHEVFEHSTCYPAIRALRCENEELHKLNAHLCERIAVSKINAINGLVEIEEKLTTCAEGEGGGREMNKVMCPVCWHEETFRALRQKTEPIRDDTPMMLWHRPEGGARGQIVTMWDGGHWRCETCGISLPTRMAALMIDAVLRVSDPDSDSYYGDTFADAMLAAEGGGR